MNEITVILTTYRRPHTLVPQVEAIRRQEFPCREIWAWANQPDAEMTAALKAARPDRVVTSSDNSYFHPRFALALTAPTEYVAVFDDDAIPGQRWFANCLATMARTPGILGTAGVRLTAASYHGRTLHGRHAPDRETVEVDLVGHAWFLRTEWVRHLFTAPPCVRTNGEDIELAARAWRLGHVRCYCPPHPPDDERLWGSVRGEELGGDGVAASRRPTHLDERDRVVRAEIALGWRPLYARDRAGNTEAPGPRSDRTTGTGHGRPGEPARPDIHDLVPGSARRVLMVGDNPKSPTESCIDMSQGRTIARVGDVYAPTMSVGEDPFDCIVCPRLDEIREPAAFLQRARDWLALGGRVIAGVQNVRDHRRVQELLDGSWSPQPSGQYPSAPVRFFTRREVEKLFFRQGFRVHELRTVPAPGHAEWVRRGRPGAVEAGRLRISPLSPADAEEFYASGYLVSASPEPVPAYGKTSIILITHNEVAYTRACVDSIRLYTDEPYELIFVDNASTDETPGYLRSLTGATVITNAENRGFPAAANQGIRTATGQNVLLLNNDTLVTSGWLKRLLRALHRRPEIGLVGPCSNYVSGTQQVPAGYEELADLDGFAWDWGKAHDDIIEDTDRLVGFCLLVRRAVIDRIGGLDERFGTGCFEDDDYCLRALRAGFRAVVAQDVFVHHFGGRTFIGSKVDFASLMHRNEQLFREKWREQQPPERPAKPQAQTTPAAVAPGRPTYKLRVSPGGGLLLVHERVRLSLCMIVRDNARTIRACLESIRDWVDEMVIVDTGSQDETPRIAAELGARVFHVPWCDSFSVARNESLKHARGAWVFWMDSDDTIDADNGRRLQELSRAEAAPGVLGYVVQVHCPGPDKDGSEDVTVVDHVKLFHNRPDLRFEGRIHEQIIPAIRRLGGEVVWTDLFVVHSGYDHTPEGQQKKLKRDLRLLHLELAEQPEHPFTLFNLGMTYTDVERHEEAIDYLRRCIHCSGDGESHLRKAYSFLVSCHEALGQTENAWGACEEGLAKFPLDAELRFRKAILLHQRGQHAEAAQTYRELFQVQEERHFQSVVAGLTGFLARHNLALVYRDMGDATREEEQWRLVVGEKPTYRPGWRGLGETLLRAGRHEEALGLANHLLGKSDLAVEGRILKSQVSTARGDLGAARRELEEAIEQWPDDLPVLQALCRVVFEQGDLLSAEKFLRELVRRDPKDASAYHNLGAVYRWLGRHGEAVEAFRESLRLRPGASPTYLQLGHALLECARPEEAIAAWRQVLQISPGDAEAAAALHQVRQCA
jgi:GT2 family glycosyltransferase/tetratricopeptide (TPR) repeat protein